MSTRKKELRIDDRMMFPMSAAELTLGKPFKDGVCNLGMRVVGGGRGEEIVMHLSKDIMRVLAKALVDRL